MISPFFKRTDAGSTTSYAALSSVGCVLIGISSSSGGGSSSCAFVETPFKSPVDEMMSFEYCDVVAKAVSSNGDEAGCGVYSW